MSIAPENENYIIDLILPDILILFRDKNIADQFVLMDMTILKKKDFFHEIPPLYPDRPVQGGGIFSSALSLIISTGKILQISDRPVQGGVIIQGGGNNSRISVDNKN